MKKRPIFFALLLSFLFISCENLLSPKDSYNNGDGKTYTITGDINIEGALPNELFNENSTNSVARTGFPTVPNFSDSELNLYVSATNADSSSTIEGTINAEKTQYSINLPKGQWTITVSGEKSDVVILEGSVTVVLNDEYPVTNSEIIILKPIKTTDGKGNLSLKLALNIGSFNCGGVKATLSSSEDPKTKYFLFTDTSEIDLVFNDIPSGTYSFNLEFYKSMIPNGTDDYECENIIYILNDTVNIFDGLTTNEWSGTGYSEDKFTLTQEMITSFAMTTFYVDADYGNDDNEGTFFAPIKSINKVLEKIDTINDGSSEYRIYIKGNINNTSENSSFINDSFINITPTETLNLLICGFGNEKSTINAERDESQTGRVMYIGENANVTLQNLILTGGYLADNNEQCDGAGLYIKNNATVKIKNCEISGNQAKDGGGLYLCPNANDDGGNLLELSNCTISGNIATSSGGGILFCPTHGSSDDKITTLNLTNCTISSNTATQMGGGIYSYGKNPEVILDACNITNNSLGSESSVPNAYGGGIYGANGTIIMNDTTISENKVASVNDVEGAGVYLSGAELTMQENSKISGNSCVFGEYASSYGGGVYINNSSTFTMTSGEISENSAKYGGGVSVSGGTFIMNGGSISSNTVSSKGNGVYVVKHTNLEAMEFSPTFEISGGASITENDVYLTAEQKITITGELSSDTVATITPENYEEVQVLAAGTGITLNDQLVRKFNVTKYSDNVETIITAITADKGCLKNTLKGTAILTKELYDICSTINVSSADGMNAISDLSQKKDGVDGKNFEGKTIILEDNIELESDYMLIKTFSGVFEGNNNTITLNKPEEYNYTNYFGGAIFNVVTGKDAEVRNLNVEGTAYIAGIAIELENDAVISNCTNSANITSPNGENVHGCGGIVGDLSDGGVIINCKNEGTITYNSTNNKGCGGIVGAISGTTTGKGNSIIANCINNGEIKRIQVQIEGKDDQKASIGGICGEVKGKAAIYNCVNTQNGSVTSLTAQNVTENIGGITGYCSVSFYTTEFTSLPGDMGIFNCYNSGSISSTNNSSSKYVGGIVGKGYVYTSTQYSLVHTIRVTNIVNNDDATFSIGHIEFYDNSADFDITNNFYKKSGESTYDVNNIDSVINILNAYSDETGRQYLEWGKNNGNIIFSKEISGN